MDDYKVLKTVDTAKTMAEHTSIVLNYRKTGLIDRDTAIKMYKDFNLHYPEYYATLNIAGAVANNLVDINDMSDLDIVANLNRQLIYLGGKNLLEGLQNG